MYSFLSVDFSGKKVIVAGAGQVGLRKGAKLLEAGADLYFFDPYIQALPWPGPVLHKRPLEAGDLEGAYLLLVATSSAEENQRLVDLAKSKGIFVNSADFSIDSSLIFPMEFKAGGVHIGLSTSGQAPFALGSIRADIEGALEGWSQERLELLAQIRQQVIQLDLTDQEKRAIYQDLLERDKEELKAYEDKIRD